MGVEVDLDNTKLATGTTTSNTTTTTAATTIPDPMHSPSHSPSHNHPTNTNLIGLLLDSWYYETLSHSTQDQLGFPYVVQQMLWGQYEYTLSFGLEGSGDGGMGSGISSIKHWCYPLTIPYIHTHTNTNTTNTTDTTHGNRYRYDISGDYPNSMDTDIYIKHIHTLPLACQVH